MNDDNPETSSLLPQESEPIEDRIDEAEEESFPASDSPATGNFD